MRLRKVKNALEKLRQNKTYFIDNPQEHIKEWEKVFGNSYPIHMEILFMKWLKTTQILII